MQPSSKVIETGDEILREYAEAGDLSEQVLTALVCEPGMAVEVLMAAMISLVGDGSASSAARVGAFVTDFSHRYEEHMVMCTNRRCDKCQQRCSRG